MRRIVPPGAFLLVALVMAACGGAAATPAAGTPTTPAASGPATSAPSVTTAPPEPTPSPTIEAATVAPGSIAYRVVNLTDAPMDAWLRTDGLVTAAAGVLGLAPGEVSGDLFPPEAGGLVVLPAGSGDPTCVSDCPFLGETSAAFGDGDRRILVVGTDGATEYWEHPSAATLGTTSNALIPADPARAILVVEAQNVTDGGFGLRLAIDGAADCLPDVAGEAPLVGGTALGAFPVDPAGAPVTIHDGSDGFCANEAVGGPFPVSVVQGGRTLLLLWGSKGSMQGVAVPLP